MSFWTGTHWEPDRSAPAKRSCPGRARHAAEAVAEGVLIAGIVGALAFAFAPVSGPASSIAGAGRADAATRTSSVWIASPGATKSSGLSYGSSFVVGYSTSARQPWVEARCFPNSSTTYVRTYADGSIWAENFSVYPGGPMPQAFSLTDPVANNWTAGGANCTLQLVKYSSDYRRYTVLATSAFTVVA
jgi:hypothetical protein